MSALEVWGGVECTVNRVRDCYYDQLERSGHVHRLEDFDRFARLGIKALRFPALWERLAPHSVSHIDWAWTDAALKRIRSLGLRPIVGLVHHGSGPSYTNLTDPLFPEKLAAFARRFAERYPWIDAYTPINEPLTTARFSGLYGLWYPHARDSRTFLQILFNECRATGCAMTQIRQVRPDAELIQTEDLGQIYSTPKLAYQAAFENARRWLALDLLAARVDESHELYQWIIDRGVSAETLEIFRRAPCRPDIIGINHYITSNRFIDEKIERYPVSAHGGNERERYADVEAVRIGPANFVSPKAVLREAWERYHWPMAVTEAHMGCTRDEQMRWLIEIWNAARELQAEGADIRAVTCWSLLGAFDWDSLLTQYRGHYEPGAFDLRGPEPRPTALCEVIRKLSRDQKPDHPALDSAGWWRRPHRVIYSDVASGDVEGSNSHRTCRRQARELLITGGTGTLGRAFARICEHRGLSYRLVTRVELDITSRDSINAALTAYKPWAVINAAGYCRVDDAERDAERCFRANTAGPALVAEACAERRLPFVTFSSDLVFDGNARFPYRESDGVAPLGVYGRSKALAEKNVLAAHPGALVVRTSAFFGPWDEYNFVTLTLRQLARRCAVRVADDMTVSPTYIPDLVNTSLDLLIDGAKGLWHLANEGATTWADFARRAASARGYSAALVLPVPAAALGFTALRPAYSALGSERGSGLMPALEIAMERYNVECMASL